jgi:tRNA threonylcarbamoyladenosine biosynthesis protein TsaB
VQTILAFDTATSVASCALLRGEDVLGERTTEARAVLAAADDLLREAKLDRDALDGLVVGTGPGSFTSLRMGLATARGLGLGLGLRAAGVSTLLAYAGGEPVIDAKRGEVFVGGPAVMRPDGVTVAGKRIVGDGAVRYRTVFEAAGAEVPPDDDPSHLPRAALLARRARDFIDPELIEPVYLRIPDAVPSR